jgi:drug/metabolite transporter (DMT)-like permease
MIVAGIAFGLLSSLALGISDLTAGLLARYVGIVRAIAGAMVISFVLLLVVLLASGLSLPTDPKWIAWIAGVALLRTCGYFALVRAYSIGPVAVVAPITASSGAVTVLAAVVLLGDKPSPLQWVAVLVATVGAVLVAINLDHPDHRVSLVGRGPVYALFAMVMLSIVVASQQPPIRDVGWLPTITLRRAFEVALTLSALVVAWRLFPHLVGGARRGTTPEVAIATGGDPSAVDGGEPSSKRRVPSRANLLARFALVGSFESLGLSSLAISLSVAPAWLFGISGSLSPLPGIAFGMFWLKERLRPVQWLGIAFVVVALFLVAVG